MPKQGQSVESCIITQWKKQPGDVVAQGEVLCEIETDKAVMDVESPVAGVLLAHFFPAGADVPVLTAIAAVGQAGEDVSALSFENAVHDRDTEKNTRIEGGMYHEAKPTSAALTEHEVKISPRARNLAARKALDIAGIEGTGPQGRIIERDVIAALNAKPRLTPLAAAKVSSGEFSAPNVGTGTGGRITTKDLQPKVDVGAQRTGAHTGSPLQVNDNVTVIPLKGVRKLIAARMLDSMQTTAQLTLNTFTDVRAVVAYRQRLKESAEAMGLRKASINDLVMFAVSRTLPQFPELNAHFKDDAIHQYQRVHLGFAVDTVRGLIVPVIRNADELSLKALANEAARLAAASVEGKITHDEMSGGTFTVSNLGSFGIETFTPILNPPQVAILGVGNIHLRPIESAGQVQFAQHIGLSLTINHQVIDGAPGARFLQALSRNLANIELLLAL
jgi:pyruvate dehydrogenase E2 component (dihydrolipoamide acetyltransferase)